MSGEYSFDARSFSEESFGLSWGLTYEAAQVILIKKKPVVSVSGSDVSATKTVSKQVKKPKQPKLHLVELYKQQEEIKVKKQQTQQDDDLLVLLGFMISGKVIT